MKFPLGKAFRWFGIEANARAIMTLIALGTIVGGLAVFAIDRLIPIISPSLSLTDYGEGYRRGKREAELEFRLGAAEGAIDRMRIVREIEEKVRHKTDAKSRADLKKRRAERVEAAE